MNLAHLSNLREDIKRLSELQEEQLEVSKLILEQLKEIANPKRIFAINEQVCVDIGMTAEQIKDLHKRVIELNMGNKID